jgi:hypothetical protein
MTNIHPYQGIFIFFVFFGFQCVQTLVPIQFPSSSQRVPQLFPIESLSYPIWFSQSWTFMYINYKNGGRLDGWVCVPVGGFPICSSSSQCVPQHVLHSTSLSSQGWQMLLSFHLCRWAKGEELLHFKIEPSIFGSLHSSFFLSDGPIKLAPCNKKKELGRQLI